MKLHFSADDHTYWLGKRRVPSVTEIIELNGLCRDWRGYETAALRGTYVHEATRLYDLEVLDEGSLTAEIAGYLGGWKKFRRDFDIIMVDIERPMYSEQYAFAGTPDRFGWDGSDPVLISIKSGSYERAHIIQEAGYTYLYPEFWPRMRTWGVYLKIDGSYHLKDLRKDAGEFLRARQVFLAGLTIARWKG